MKLLTKTAYFNLIWIVPFLAFTSLSSCSKVLSHRTDEQAWIEFDKEVRQSRTPAAFVDTGSPGLSKLHQVLEETPVREFLLKCGSSSTAQACYQSELTLHFDEAFRALEPQFSELKPSDYKREQKSFFAYRAYETIFDEVSRFHQSILSGLDLKAREHAADFFKICEKESQKEPFIEDFNILPSFNFEMPKGTYSCLHEHWFSDQQLLLQETMDRLGLSIVTKEAREWIETQQIAPIYEAEINTVVAKKSKLELEQFRLEKNEVFANFDHKASTEKLLKEWSPKLHERYPYSPVEQWIAIYAADLAKNP